MKLTEKKYTVQQIMEMTGFSQPKVSRLASKMGWEVERVKEGRVYKNYYQCIDVQVLMDELFPVAIVEKKLQKSKMQLIKEQENPIKDIMDVSDEARDTAFARSEICSRFTVQLMGLKNKRSQAKKLGVFDRTDKSLSITQLYEDFPKKLREKDPELCKRAGSGNLSSKTLRRWLKRYDPMDLLKLVDGRELCPTEGMTIISQEQLDVFHALFFTKNQPKLSQVYKKMQGIFNDLPSEPTFRNYIEKVPDIVKDFKLLDEKAFKDKWLPHVVRDYSSASILPNDEWVSDAHDMDLFFRHPKTGKKTRAEIVVWQDQATRLWTGWALTFTENSESILTSLKRGIEKFGKPKRVYTDNGAAYRGKRVEDIYKALGVEVTFAIPRNAQGKAVERTFRNFKESFSAFSIAYKGGHIFERPERLTEVLKTPENLLSMDELTALLDDWIVWRNHQKHRGHGMRGRSPMERFNEELPENQRDYIRDDFLRETLFFYNEERTVHQHGIDMFENTYQFDNFPVYIGTRVKLKFDPNDLRVVYVYDQKGRMLGVGKGLVRAKFNGDMTQWKEVKKSRKQVRQLAKRYDEALVNLAENETTNIYLESAKPYIPQKKTVRQIKTIEAEVSNVNNSPDEDSIYHKIKTF